MFRSPGHPAAHLHNNTCAALVQVCRWAQPHCAVLCCAVLCCAVLCCAVLCCAVLCCAVLCCAVLCCVVQEWVERYKANRASAAAELMTLLVKVRHTCRHNAACHTVVASNIASIIAQHRTMQHLAAAAQQLPG
jgi:hypothetical protein